VQRLYILPVADLATWEIFIKVNAVSLLKNTCSNSEGVNMSYRR
jgi:hypothetical protein